MLCHAKDICAPLNWLAKRLILVAFLIWSFLFPNTIGQWVWHWVSNKTSNNSSNGFCLVSVRVLIFFVYSPNKRGFNTDLYFPHLDTLLDQTPYTLITSISWLLLHRFIHFMHNIIHSFRFTKFVHSKCLSSDWFRDVSVVCSSGLCRSEDLNLFLFANLFHFLLCSHWAIAHYFCGNKKGETRYS